MHLWLSPAFPAGSYAYSHGLEWAVQAGCVRDLDSLVRWLADLLAHGAARTDAILFKAAWTAATARDAAALRQTNALALALTGSSERYLETSQQGTSFLAAIRAAWGNEPIEWAATAIDASTGPRSAASPAVAYPVAVAIAVASHAIPLETALPAFLLAWASNLMSAAIRLGAIGQTDGQRALAQLIENVQICSAVAARSTLDDLGQCAFRSDLAALRHETQYSRLFRS